jgi:hypothetical protein
MDVTRSDDYMELKQELPGSYESLKGRNIKLSFKMKSSVAGNVNVRLMHEYESTGAQVDSIISKEFAVTSLWADFNEVIHIPQKDFASISNSRLVLYIGFNAGPDHFNSAIDISNIKIQETVCIFDGTSNCN